MFLRVCPICEHRNPSGSRFCNECGSPLHLRFCPTCGAADDVLATVCHACGALLPEVLPRPKPVKEPATPPDKGFATRAANEPAPSADKAAPQPSIIERLAAERLSGVGPTAPTIVRAVDTQSAGAPTPAAREPQKDQATIAEASSATVPENSIEPAEEAVGGDPLRPETRPDPGPDTDDRLPKPSPAIIGAMEIERVPRLAEAPTFAPSLYDAPATTDMPPPIRLPMVSAAPPPARRPRVRGPALAVIAALVAVAAVAALMINARRSAPQAPSTVQQPTDAPATAAGSVQAAPAPVEQVSTPIPITIRRPSADGDGTPAAAPSGDVPAAEAPPAAAQPARAAATSGPASASSGAAAPARRVAAPATGAAASPATAAAAAPVPEPTPVSPCTDAVAALGLCSLEPRQR